MLLLLAQQPQHAAQLVKPPCKRHPSTPAQRLQAASAHPTPTGAEPAHLMDMSAALTSHTALASNHTSGISVSPYLRVADCSIEGYNRLKVKNY